MYILGTKFDQKTRTFCANVWCFFDWSSFLDVWSMWLEQLMYKLKDYFQGFKQNHAHVFLSVRSSVNEQTFFH